MTKQELRERIAATKTGKERTRYASALMRATVEHARPRVAAGESLSIVADELGLKAGTLQRWCSSLGKSAIQPETAVSVQRADALTFLRLDAVVPPAPPRTGGQVEIVLPSGVLVRVPIGFDVTTLSRVLSLMKGAA